MTAITSFRERTDHRSEDELVRDYRQRQADAEFERSEIKRMQLADQRSELSDAKARIQAWEKVHGLRMPASPTHPVLQVIATATAWGVFSGQPARRAVVAPRAHPRG